MTTLINNHVEKGKKEGEELAKTKAPTSSNVF